MSISLYFLLLKYFELGGSRGEERRGKERVVVDGLEEGEVRECGIVWDSVGWGVGRENKYRPNQSHGIRPRQVLYGIRGFPFCRLLSISVTRTSSTSSSSSPGAPRSVQSFTFFLSYLSLFILFFILLFFFFSFSFSFLILSPIVYVCMSDALICSCYRQTNPTPSTSTSTIRRSSFVVRCCYYCRWLVECNVAAAAAAALPRSRHTLCTQSVYYHPPVPVPVRLLVSVCVTCKHDSC